MEAEAEVEPCCRCVRGAAAAAKGAQEALVDEAAWRVHLRAGVRRSAEKAAAERQRRDDATRRRRWRR